MTGGSGRHHKVAQAVPYICTLGVFCSLASCLRQRCLVARQRAVAVSPPPVPDLVRGVWSHAADGSVSKSPAACLAPTVHGTKREMLLGSTLHRWPHCHILGM
jgi:hypothetical protein